MRATSFPILLAFIATFYLSLLRAEPESHVVDRELYEEQLLLNHLNDTGLLSKMHAAQSLRMYIGKSHADIGNYKGVITSEDGLYPGPLLNLSRCELSPDLYPVRNWLHLHMEYSADAYVYLRFKTDFTVVASAEEADLCFGHCDDGKEIPWMRNQYPMFVVPRGKENTTFYCGIMNFVIEDYRPGIDRNCRVTAPYVSSITPPMPLL